MATKNLIAGGIGFQPGSVKYIVTRGLSLGAVPPPPSGITVFLKARTKAVLGRNATRNKQ